MSYRRRKVSIGFSRGETNNNRFLPFGRNDIVICFTNIKTDSKNRIENWEFKNKEKRRFGSAQRPQKSQSHKVK